MARTTRSRAGFALAGLSALSVLGAGCDGGGGGSGGGGGVTAAIAPLASSTDAARFLTQATFGPTPEEIEFVQRHGYEYWLEYQTLLPATSHLELLDGYGQGQYPDPALRTDTWWLASVRGQDQLRQRVAFALSQIFVVSELELAGGENARGLANYYDLLAQHAFGNYHDLLEAVTLSPIMGIYLSHVRNEKAQPALNIRPDENYAREAMQLFSIGLVQLNEDGTAALDSSSNPIPTYDQEVIEGFAAVFTGWTYAGTTDWGRPSRDVLQPMISFPDYHDLGAKRLLNNVVLPPNGTAESDLEGALSSIFAHPNVGPFIGKQLIQRLVTSNPSPAYVARVARVFANDGRGVRGNLRAVVRAILLDREARDGHEVSPTTFGKVREPLLRHTALWRAFRAGAANGVFDYSAPERDLAQAPLRSPSVFNFYRPDHAPPGEVSQAGLVGPELQILTESSITATTNRWFQATFDRYSGRPNVPGDGIVIDIEEEKALVRAGQLQALLDRLNLLLLSGRMSSITRTIVGNHIASIPVGPADDGAQPVVEAIYLIVSSPEFALQR
jgi:uncharacterized protein (DUF1800 family)